MSRHVEIKRALAAYQPDRTSLSGQGTVLRQKRPKRPKRQHGPCAQPMLGMAVEHDGLVMHAAEAESGGIMAAAAFAPDASLLTSCAGGGRA
jgi:hypothetical protein